MGARKSLHRMPDVTIDEDRGQIRKDNARRTSLYGGKWGPGLYRDIAGDRV